ncbi:MAG TPA: pyruvate kinase [Xanthomonadales bacterium]|nr:pyruvate kinase [Xanthomonadales bacterium]
MNQTNKKRGIRRRTKIIATLGPALEDRSVLKDMIAAGANVLRLNFSHGDPDSWVRHAQAVREVSAELGREVAILADLAGPKIRIEHFRNGSIALHKGDTFTLDTSDTETPGDENRVGVNYPSLAEDVSPGVLLLLDDGLIAMRVSGIEGKLIHCVVETGGVLRNRKGLNIRGGGLSVSGITEKDIDDIPIAARLEADYVAVSFVTNGDDIRKARKLLRQAGSNAGVIAKIERSEAIVSLEEICETADAILVARGDLGVEIGDAALPGIQKRIINTAVEYNRNVITATQMMLSMVDSPIPTRAEVLDVANAVIDGTDAVMLSEETAVGKHPTTVVEAVDRVCLGAERHSEENDDIKQLNVRFQRIDQAIAMAATFLSTNVSVQAIVAFTESGSTALWLSRVQSPVPIFALSPCASTRRKMALYRNVIPVAHVPQGDSMNVVVTEALKLLWDHDAITVGDRIILTMGERQGDQGGTNTMRLIRIGPEGRAEHQAELDMH